MNDQPHCGAVRRHRRERDPRTARVLALREARQRGELVIDRDRIAHRMLG